MSAQQQSVFTGLPAPMYSDVTFTDGNVTGSISLSTPGSATYLTTSVGSKVGLFGVPAVQQQTTAVSGVTVAGTGSGTILTSTTFNNYTIAQVVAALINVGILSTA